MKKELEFTDAPEGTTEEEWQQRYEDWDFLDVPSVCGLTYEFTGEKDFGNPLRMQWFLHTTEQGL